MTKSITKIFGVALATTLAATAVSPAAPAGSPATNAASKLDSLLGDPVIAKGKGLEIKRSQLDAEMIAVQSMANAQGRTLTGENLLLIQRQKLNDLISFQLLLAKATDADKAKGKEQFAKALERLKKDNKLTDAEFDEKLGTQLRLQGLARADWDKQRLEQGAVAAVLERELKLEVTDEAAKKFYDENPTKFEQPEQVRASHILIGTKDPATGADLSDEQKKAKRKQIDDLRKRATQGEDFAKLAKEFTEDPGSKETGGEYTFGRGRMVPEFEAAAFSLSTNQISDVVTTTYGYHIIKLSEKIPAKVISFAEVSDDLKEALKNQELQKALADGEYLEKLRKDASVEILDEKLKKLDEMLPKEDKAAAKADAKVEPKN
jgi:parvulin-like peptidyl-prolyl isomerase